MTDVRVMVLGLGGIGSAATYWASRRLGPDVLGIEQFEELLVGRAPLLLAGQQVIVGAIYRAEAPGHVVSRNKAARPEQRLAGSMRLSDLDLIEDEIEVGANIGDHLKILPATG